MAAPFLDPERGYTDISRPDSSVNLRWGIRSFWGTGEQLWDIDMNNTFSQLSFWMNPIADRCRSPKPPYPPVPPDSAYTQISNGSPYYAYVSSVDTNYRTGFVGATVYVERDWTYRVLAPNGASFKWVPYVWAPRDRELTEIAIYVSDAPPGTIVRYTVETAFRMFHQSLDDSADTFDPDATSYVLDRQAVLSNVRGVPTVGAGSTQPSCKLMRNGVQVGEFRESSFSFSHYLQYTQGLRFEAGDELSIEYNRTAAAMAFSIVGRRI